MRDRLGRTLPHHLCILDDDGQQRHSRKIAHAVEGLDVLIAMINLVDRCGTYRDRTRRRPARRASPASLRCRNLLRVTENLGAGTRTLPYGGSQVRRIRRLCSGRHLAPRHAQWRPLATRSPALAELTAISRGRQRILDMQVDTENRLRAILEAYPVNRPISPRLGLSEYRRQWETYGGVTDAGAATLTLPKDEPRQPFINRFKQACKGCTSRAAGAELTFTRRPILHRMHPSKRPPGGSTLPNFSEVYFPRSRGMRSVTRASRAWAPSNSLSNSKPRRHRSTTINTLRVTPDRSASAS